MSRRQTHRTPRRPCRAAGRLFPPAVRASAILAAVVIVPLACGGNRWTPRGGRLELTAVYESVARYVVQHYAPGRVGGEPPEVACLATGRRAGQVLTRQERDTEWDPDADLLQRLEGLVYPVVPASRCAWNRELAEEETATGRPAFLVAVEYPRWETERSIVVRVGSRETEGYTFVYGCSLAWRIDQWMVQHCLPEDGARRFRARP